MTKPILTPTEYDALCNILEWAWSSVHQEPELCLKEVNYENSDEHDCVMAGECGLGLAEAFEYTLNDPNQRNIMTMIENLMYKLNSNPILANGLGNSWETLAPLVDNEERCRLDDLDNDPDTTMQTLEGYNLENIGLKNKMSRVQEHFENVSENGMIEISDGFFIDAVNSDLIK